MSRSLQVLSIAGIAALVAACGGDNGSDIASGGNGGTQLQPSIYTSEGRILNSCSLEPACSNNPYAPFFAEIAQAPADGAALRGVMRLEVRGNELAGVELLPATGYLPRYGVFNISGDKTLAWLDFDTSTLPNGATSFRISAYDATPREQGREIVAMSPRAWTINNSGAPPSSFTAAATSRPSDGATVSGTTRLEVRGSGIVNAELLPGDAASPSLGTFNVSSDRSTAWLDFDSRSLPDGGRSVRIAAYNATAGQPGATEIIAMPARSWNISNGSSGFIANVTMAPAYGAAISGPTRLEVRGSGLRNVELLPATGYAPRYGLFNVSGDGSFAWLDFDPAGLPNGPVDVRISAFNAAAGTPGAAEIVAMPARQWVVSR